MRVFFDTNVLVSAFATRGLCADLFQAVLAEHQLVTGEAVLHELRKVLGQKLKMNAAGIAEIDEFLRAQGDVVADAPPISVAVRDPSDRLVLAEAVAGQPDVLVTGDADLLVLPPKAPIPIVAPRAFWELLRQSPRGS